MNENVLESSEFVKTEKGKIG